MSRDTDKGLEYKNGESRDFVEVEVFNYEALKLVMNSSIAGVCAG